VGGTFLSDKNVNIKSHSYVMLPNTACRTENTVGQECPTHTTSILLIGNMNAAALRTLYRDYCSAFALSIDIQAQP